MGEKRGIIRKQGDSKTLIYEQLATALPVRATLAFHYKRSTIMTAQELIKILEKHPDFEVQFIFGDTMQGVLDMRVLNNLDIADVGYSDKVILLTGDERKR